MAELRPTTNLVVPETLQLDKEAIKSKFFYIYRKLYKEPEVVFMTRLWACPLLPSIGNDTRMGSARRGIKEAYKVMKKQTPSGYLSIKKVTGADPYFRVSVPLFAFNKHSMTGLSLLLNEYMLGGAYEKVAPDVVPEHLQDTQNLQEMIKQDNPEVPSNVVIPVQRVISSINGLDARSRVALQSCLEQIRVQTKGGLAVIFADFKITREEAQQLTSTHWIELRDIDLYPMLLEWVRTGFGAEGIAPFVAFPISRVASTLPKAHSAYARINEDGISISPKGRPMFLPKELNQTLLYEDRYSQAGTRADGSYALVDINEGASAMEAGTEVKQKLPPNIPVLIDWVNNKYSYTNTSGFLEVEDLTRYRTADVSHIRSLLEERVLTDPRVAQMIALGAPANVHPAAFTVLDTDVEGVDDIGERLPDQNPMDWFAFAAAKFAKTEAGRPVVFSDISTTGYPLFRPIARYFKAIKEAVLSNLDAVYAKYSVHYVMETLAWLILTVNYASSFEDLKARDKTNRKAALEQKVTPGWVPPSIPLLGKRLTSDEGGLLPHQIKVRNLMKDSPDFALFRVQAGGGKSVLALTDILYEIKANRNQPYLILCPGHLVANYVKEVVDFTDGKLNVLALNTYVIKQNGYDRLQAMFEKAPRNTIVVADYDVLKRGQQVLCYGTTPIVVYPVIDFLRQFHFGYVLADESHKLKNETTARSRSVMSLITDIPKKRMASGTMAHDSPSDLAMQVASMDPTLFGTKEEFNKQYGLKVEGERVVEWKPGAQDAIKRKIKSRIVDAEAMRKEWAALLPRKTEWIKGVMLTENQYRVYNEILTGVLTQIKEDAKGDKKLQEFINPEAAADGDGEDQEDELKDEDSGMALENKLKRYLQRLERFLIAPASDVLGNLELKGEDRVSSKAQMIVDRLRMHIEQGIPGKVLIFTNWVESANEIYRLAGPELQKMGILYKATNKDVDGARFEKDDKIKWMVGVSSSMEEGLNFQFASRLIRCETVWNPGTLEQGDSRINRPELKAPETRNEIFYDWVVAAGTIDITKMSRLISKVVAVAKFENTDNPAYAAIPDLPVIKMSFENIETLNSWDSLSEYNEAYAQYKHTRDEEYADYKENYKAKFGTDPKRQSLGLAANPGDAKLMSRVPYTPGLDIYGAAESGLVRLDQYINKPELAEEEGDEVDEEEVEDTGEMTPEQRHQQALIDSLVGKVVHTEYGDGILHSVGLRVKRCPVDLFSGFTALIRKSAIFVVTRTETSTKDIRNELLKKVGELPIDTPVEVPALVMKQSNRALKIAEQNNKKAVIKKEKQKQQKLLESLNVELQFTLVNGYLGITYFPQGEDDTMARALQAVGFRPDPTFYYARMPSAARLKRQLNLWQEKGFRPDPSILKAGAKSGFAELYNLLKGGKVISHQDTYKMTSAANVKNFYRMEHKASNEKHLFKPYPLIEDEVAYIALPIQGQTASKLAIQVKATNVIWKTSKPTLSYFGSVQQIEHKMKQIGEAGIAVSNAVELTTEFKKLKKMKIRSDESAQKDIGEF
jgi:SNF2-related domain